MARVLVGLSGGVDSSAAAALLGEQGHNSHSMMMNHGNDKPETGRPDGYRFHAALSRDRQGL